jgi:hypothetical protein
MPTGPLKAVGEHPVSVSLHTDVLVEVTVAVVGEAPKKLEQTATSVCNICVKKPGSPGFFLRH